METWSSKVFLSMLQNNMQFCVESWDRSGSQQLDISAQVFVLNWSQQILSTGYSNWPNAWLFYDGCFARIIVKIKKSKYSFAL